MGHPSSPRLTGSENPKDDTNGFRPASIPVDPLFERGRSLDSKGGVGRVGGGNGTIDESDSQTLLSTFHYRTNKAGFETLYTFPLR